MGEVSILYPMTEDTSLTSLLNSPKSASRAEKAWLIVACVCILGGGVLFIYGEQATGVGFAGVVTKLVGGLGMVAFSVGVLIVGICFAKWIVIGWKARTPSERTTALKALGKQTLVVLINILVYGGCFILILGGIAALDGASITTLLAALIIWAACIAIFVLYRRYRKKHKMSYKLIGDVSLTAFLLAFAVFMLFAFTRTEIPNAVQDIAEGPETADVLLVEADIDYATGRYRALVQDQHVLTFYTPDEERIVLIVPEKDVAAAQVINEYGNFVHLTYYPRTQVFCEAAPWLQGASEMGVELLDKLVREYAFEL